MSISQEQRASLLEQNRKMGWEALPSTVPAFVRAFVTECRTAGLEQRSMNTSFLRTHQQGVEQRSSLMLRTLRVTPTGRRKSYEEEYFERTGREYKCRDILRAKADAVLAEIRRDERRAEEHFIATASPAELLKALEAKCGRSAQPGSDLAPGAPCCNACTPDQHARAATFHRTKGQRADSWQRGAAHFGAADAHARAAEQFSADTSVAARAASQKVFEDWEED